MLPQAWWPEPWRQEPEWLLMSLGSVQVWHGSGPLAWGMDVWP
jgi:hypothetical protein